MRQPPRPGLPAGAADPWEQARARAERAPVGARRWISDLAPLAGDPEAVTDEHGRLPRVATTAPFGPAMTS